MTWGAHSKLHNIKTNVQDGTNLKWNTKRQLTDDLRQESWENKEHGCQLTLQNKVVAVGTTFFNIKKMYRMYLRISYVCQNKNRLFP